MQRTTARTCCEHYGPCNQGRDCPARSDDMRGAAGIVVAVVIGLMVWAAVAAALIAHSGATAPAKSTAPTTTTCLRSMT